MAEEKYIVSFYEFPCGTIPNFQNNVFGKEFNSKTSAFRWIALSYVVPRLIEEEVSFVNSKTGFVFEKDNSLIDFSDKHNAYISMYTEINDKYEDFIDAYFEYAKKTKDIIAGYDVKTVYSDYGTLYDALEHADGIEIDETHFVRHFYLDEDNPEAILSVEIDDDGHIYTYTFSIQDLFDAVEVAPNKWRIEKDDVVIECYYFM